jgi:uncharacterized protein (UPF0335 family)
MDDGNGGPLAGLRGYLDEIDRQDDELATLKADYMNSCKQPRSVIREIVESAKEAGLNMKAFREILRAHRVERGLDKRLEALDMADLADFKSMEDALGDFIDTPLGQAAKAAASVTVTDKRPEPMF